MTLLGTGDAGGTPRHGCRCAACRTLVRSPARAFVEAGAHRVPIDAGAAWPDGAIDAVLLTHFHFDHVARLVPMQFGVGERIPVYAPDDPERRALLFEPESLLDFRPAEESFAIGEIQVTPLPLRHSAPTVGWHLWHRGQSLAYLADTRGLPEQTRAFLVDAPPDLLILDCTWPPDPDARNHNDLDLALHDIEEIGPRRAILTHISHELDMWRLESGDTLPDGVQWGRDDLALTLV